jgi:hypothetical protein
LPYFWSSRVKEDDPVVAVVVDMVSVDMVAIFVRVVTKILRLMVVAITAMRAFVVAKLHQVV